MQFLYREAFKASTPEPYETLLLDIMLGDATLFMRADQVESAWSIITPILEAWDAVPTADLPNYQPGTGDKRLLRVILQNLLGNAWKYSGEQEEPVIEFGVMSYN
jgi:glucose-6-phosphate 1-dehydrogenase